MVRKLERWHVEKSVHKTVLIHPKIKDRNSRTIATLALANTREETEANADLLAASPEMLYELRLMTETMEDLIKVLTDPSVEDYCNLRIRHARALLNKIDKEA